MMRMTGRVTGRVLAAMSAAGLALGLAGCQLTGGGGDDAASAPPASAASSAGAATSGAGGEGGGAPGNLGSYETSVDGEAATVTLNSVDGSGSTITVTFTVTNNDTENDMWVYDAFSDGDDAVPQADGKASPGGDTNNADGLTLTEPSSSTVYRVAYDGNGGCLCSGPLAQHVKPGNSVVLQATFAGVPAEASKVTVAIPGGGTFSNVTVTR